MGRALKIQKTNNSILTDAGFPNFGSLTSPATPYNSADTLNSDQFVGVVGGAPTISSPTTTFPEILPQVNILLADGTSTGAGNGRIIRQKGAHKFLVCNASTVNDGSFIVGQAYIIISYGTTTDWTAAGAPATVAAGDIFTATSIGGSGNGTACPVGVCVLSNTATPAAGYMSVEYSINNDSTLVFASYITNKWVRDWNGMTYANYSNSNDGENIYSGENFYVANFFTDDGTVTWSGADVINSANGQNGSIPLAQVVNITS